MPRSRDALFTSGAAAGPALARASRPDGPRHPASTMSAGPKDRSTPEPGAERRGPRLRARHRADRHDRHRAHRSRGSRPDPRGDGVGSVDGVDARRPAVRRLFGNAVPVRSRDRQPVGRLWPSAGSPGVCPGARARLRGLWPGAQHRLGPRGPALRRSVRGVVYHGQRLYRGRDPARGSWTRLRLHRRRVRGGLHHRAGRRRVAGAIRGIGCRSSQPPSSHWPISCSAGCSCPNRCRARHGDHSTSGRPIRSARWRLCARARRSARSPRRCSSSRSRRGVYIAVWHLCGHGPLRLGRRPRRPVARLCGRRGDRQSGPAGRAAGGAPGASGGRRCWAYRPRFSPRVATRWRREAGWSSR